jgi:serine protease inhibitor
MAYILTARAHQSNVPPQARALLGVDEHGVEAAAAAAVTLRYGAPSEWKQVNADRPFFFGIYDRPTSTWLFLGHVTDPSS